MPDTSQGPSGEQGPALATSPASTRAPGQPGPQSSPGLATLRVHSSGHVGTPAGSWAGPQAQAAFLRQGYRLTAMRLPVPHAAQGGSGAGETGTIYHSFPPRGPTRTLRWHKRGQPHLHLPSAQHCFWVLRLHPSCPTVATLVLGPLGAHLGANPLRLQGASHAASGVRVLRTLG